MNRCAGAQPELQRCRLIIAARLLLVVAVAFLTSCATLPVRPEEKLTGRWRYEHADRAAEYHFQDNGTFTGNVKIGGRVVADFTGRWSVAGGAIQYEYLRDKKGSIAPGTRDEDKLISVTRATFVIEAQDGSRRTYERVQE
jgi:hypothetical protein